MDFYVLATSITSLLTFACFDSASSKDTIQYDPLSKKETGEPSNDEIMDVAENVVFRPYFQHHLHHSHPGVHHHTSHPSTYAHLYTEPEAAYLYPANTGNPANTGTPVITGIDAKTQSNLIRRSYPAGSYPGASGIYPSAGPIVSPSWYASKPVPSSGYYNPGSVKGGHYSVPISNVPATNLGSTKHSLPPKCYCVPTSSHSSGPHQKSNDGYYQDYYNEVVKYYNDYYNHYPPS